MRRRAVALLGVLIAEVAVAVWGPPDPSSWGPVTASVSEAGEVWRVTGAASTFGGPWDGPGQGNEWSDAAKEGLAVWSSADYQDLVRMGVAIDLAPSGVGMARRLDPSSYYVAARWPRWGVEERARSRRAVRGCQALVRGPGGAAWAVPVDWGPDERTGRAVDLSPGLARRIGARTGSVVTLVLVRR